MLSTNSPTLENGSSSGGKARILDGRAIAGKLQAEIAKDAKRLTAAIGRKPSLAVVLVGDDPASHIYVSNKARTAQRLGIRSVVCNLPANSSMQQIGDTIDKVCGDPDMDGVILQLPLPQHQAPAKLIERILITKDVDGLTIQNTGSLWAGKSTRLRPCTPNGIMHLLKSAAGIPRKMDGSIDLSGMFALVIGRSRLVGRPLATLLLQSDATVAVAHLLTGPRLLKEMSTQADILVVATGASNLITADMVKPGAIVIDVGISRLSDGSIVGDVDFKNVVKKAGFITPVPGGVGPMTITCLLENTIIAAADIAGIKL